MGKNKYDYDDSIYDQQTNEEVADSLEKYCEEVQRFIIPDGKNAKVVKESIKKVKKACKKLREGKPEKVFDEEGYLRAKGEITKRMKE